MGKWSKYMPRGRVYFPKFVCINNPRLALLYYVVLIVVFGIFAMRINQAYLGKTEVKAEVYVTTWKLQRPLQEILDAQDADENADHCKTPGHLDYAFADISFTGITCAKICSPTSGYPCVTPGELFQVNHGKEIFIPTLFREEVVDPTGNATSVTNHFIPAVEGSKVVFSHQYTYRETTKELTKLATPQTGHSSDSEADDLALVMTVLLGRDGTEARRWEPGQAIEMTLAEMMTHAGLTEFSDDVSRLDLESRYIRVDEDIIDDLGDTGVAVRVSGASIYVDLEYTNQGSCQRDTGSTPVPVVHKGKVACMTIKAIRHWVSRTSTNVIDLSGKSKVRQYNGLQIEFRTAGSFLFVDGKQIVNLITDMLIWYQIPGFLILYFIITVLGHLSTVYHRVIHQSMSIKEAVTGLGTRLVGHSSAYLDIAESRTEGIDKSRMIERFRLIFADNEELDDEEVVKLVDYIHNSMTGAEDTEEARKVSMENFCSAATSNEPLHFGSIVDIFDKDRDLNPVEDLFNDQTIQSIRLEHYESVEDSGGAGAKSDEHSQLDTVSKVLLKQKARYARLADKVQRTLGQAETTLQKESENLFEHRRQDLIKQGAPQSRPPQKMANGAMFHGDWVGNTRHGYGTEIWPDGTTYEGQWAAGRLHGHAIYRQPNGAKYAGQWINGKQHGKGVHVSESGAKYEGQFQHGLKMGKGRIYLVDGSTYDGEVVDNNMHGPGYYEWIDGKTYKGEWVNNLMHGKGTYTFNDGCEYTGDYVDNEKHGHGVFKWPDGKRYEGQYVNNKRSGKGTFIMPDGTRIEGTWKDGKQDGPGTVQAPNGKVQEARWDMGILVQ